MSQAESTLGERDTAYLRGVAMVMLAGAFWSLGGLLVRSMESAGAWQILFVRSVTVALTVLAVLMWRYGGSWPLEIRRAGWPALVAGLALGGAFCGFIFAVLHTTIANAVLLLSVSPLVAAGLAWLLLREPVRRATWFAMAGAMAGVGLMVGGGIAAGAWFGNLMALLTMAGFAVFAVALRWAHGVDMLPAVLWAGLLSAAVAALMAADFAITPRDIVLSAAMGAAITGGMLLFTAGARSVPSAELALLSLSEVVLGPLWVWLAYAEVPRLETLLGGGIVVLALIGRALSGMRRRTPPFGAV